MSDNNKTQARREGPALRLVVADLVRPLMVQGRRSHRSVLKLIHGRWDPEPDPAERHSARLALAA
ncbi:MAG: hypothetical protein QUV05_02235 [Phycisphaerae bacterium]|jgi:hypothetical protein|nr:hypothetical protein [Phycisphaerae bacterium]